MKSQKGHLKNKKILAIFCKIWNVLKWLVNFHLEIFYTMEKIKIECKTLFDISYLQENCHLIY